MRRIPGLLALLVAVVLIYADQNGPAMIAIAIAAVLLLWFTRRADDQRL